jgi:hypothetical protein
LTIYLRVPWAFGAEEGEFNWSLFDTRHKLDSQKPTHRHPRELLESRLRHATPVGAGRRGQGS